MIVVADTSPLSCLIQIGWESLLPKLYKSIVIPPGVLLELAHPSAPSEVHSWLQQIPSWVAVEKAPLWPDGSLAYLGLGEREAIQIAQEKHADLLRIDERKGSVEAQRRGLAVTGTLGVLIAAGELGFIDPRAAYRQLIRQTTFRSSAQLEARFMVLTNASSEIGSTSTAHRASPAPSGLPDLIVHCDWGTHPNKRWMAKAVLTNGQFTAHPPERVGDLDTLIDRICKERGPNGSALLGFDFPIGVTAAYAKNAEISSFAQFLLKLGEQEWKDFYEICLRADEISIHRPFYPYNFTPKGSKSPSHLIEKLGLKDTSDLLRICERPQNGRGAAGPLFWTLGPKAPGRGARIGWKEVLAPTLRKKQIQIWPFQGKLHTLLSAGSTVVAETYPTQYYAGIFGRLKGSKTDQNVRAKAGPAILEWVKVRSDSIELAPGMHAEIDAGLHQGDDAFDAVIGLIGMIDAIQTWDARHEPSDPTIQKIEGWILGQSIP
jgi:predicted nucleic acid-binding protein